MPDQRKLIVELVPALRAFARTFHRSPNDADDLVQETLTKALEHIEQFEPGTNMKSWLFTIMRNTFYTNIKRYVRESPGHDDNVSDRRSAGPEQEWKLALNEVRDAIAALPREQREVLVLVAVLGTSYDDAAQICGCETGTIKSRLNRARHRLVRLLGGTDADELLASVSMHGTLDTLNEPLRRRAL